MTDSNKSRLRWLLIILFNLFWMIGLALAGLLMSNEDPEGYLVFAIFAGLSILIIVVAIKSLIFSWHDPQRLNELTKKYTYVVHGYLIQDYSALYIAWKKIVLLVPFLTSMIAIGIFTFLFFKFNLLLTFEAIFPESLSMPLKFVGIFYIFNFICMTIYMTGYLITGEMLQRMFKKAKRNILIETLFNYFYALPYLLGNPTLLVQNR